MGANLHVRPPWCVDTLEDWLVDEGDGMNLDAKLARADGECVQTELTDGRIRTEEVMAACAKIVLSWS